MKVDDFPILDGSDKPVNELTAQPIWDRQPFENDLWYGRFIQYRDLGPKRSVSLVSRGRRNAYPIPAHWAIIAKQNRWKERAQAFDAASAPPASALERAKPTNPGRPGKKRTNGS